MSAIFELDRLVRADRAAERLALLRVRDAVVQARLRQADRERRDRDPRAGQDSRHCANPRPRSPSRFLPGRGSPRTRARACRSRASRACGRTGPTVTPGVSGRARGSWRGRGPPPGSVAAATTCDVVMRRAAVRDEGLRAVDHPLAAVEPRGRPRGGGVRAAVGLGERERAERLARGRAARASAPSARACRSDATSCPARPTAAESVIADRLVDAPELLHREADRHRVGVGAAVLLRQRAARTARARPSASRPRAGTSPRGRAPRPPGATTSSANRRTTPRNVLLLGREVEVHRSGRRTPRCRGSIRSGRRARATRHAHADLPGPVAEQPVHQHRVGAVELHQRRASPARRAARRRCPT